MIDRAVIVRKPSRLDELISEYQTHGAAAFVLESRGDSIAEYDREHQAYETAIDRILSGIPADLDTVLLSRSELSNFLFRDKDLVIACGPDGLFVNLAQYVGTQPVLGVNPDRKTISGKLMVFKPEHVQAAVAGIREGAYQSEHLPYVRATIDRDRVVWGINDIFLGRQDQVSARYSIAFNGKSERHSSSGVIVSTAIGANGWLRSIAAMVEGLIEKNAAHSLLDIPGPTTAELRFVVREPFPSPQTGTALVSGAIYGSGELELVSEMPHGGVVFSDGNVNDAIEWPAGAIVRVGLGDRTICRVIPNLPKGKSPGRTRG